jgi:hypothetical protein
MRVQLVVHFAMQVAMEGIGPIVITAARVVVNTKATPAVRLNTLKMYPSREKSSSKAFLLNIANTTLPSLLKRGHHHREDAWRFLQRSTFLQV